MTRSAEIVIYEGADARVEVRVEREDVWLSLQHLASLFGRDKSVISRHLRNVFASGELVREATVAKNATVQREVVRDIDYYNLDATISVGYRVNSSRATRFRQWVTRVLREHLTQGFSLDRERLARNAAQLEAALALVQKTAAGEALTAQQGRGLVDVLTRYTRCTSTYILATQRRCLPHTSRILRTVQQTHEKENTLAAIGKFFLIPPQNWLFPNHGDVLNAKREAEEYKQKNGSYEGAEFVIEEFVRQWALSQLFMAYNYPSEWLGERITIEEPVKMGSTEKEADISIKNSNRRAFLYIEAKRRNISDKEFSDAERQLESYLAATHTATIGMVTDGVRVKTIRKKIEPNDFDYVPDLPSFGLESKIRAQLIRELPEGIGNAHTTGLRILDEDYERILFNCHSAARDTDGLHADESLDEICKVLYAKIFDEQSTTKQNEAVPFRFQTYGASNASEVASNIRLLYEEARNADVEIYSKRIPDYERSRGVFNSRIRLSDAALYRVVEQLQEFSIIDSSADIKGRAFQKVLGSAIRAGMGQYFTPDPVVELAIGVIEPKATDLILDPFCGSGHFLTKALQFVIKYQKNLPPHALHEFKFFHLHGIEKSDRMVRIAMTDMMLHGDGHTNIRNQDALLSFDNYPDIIALRENGERDPAVFDVVLTNPPFGGIMKQEAMEMLGRFDLAQGKKSLPLEIMGLERSLHFVKPGGKVAIVLPEHLMKGKKALFVRKWLYNVAHIRAIFFFPEDAFTPFGAMVKTCLCILQKLMPGEKLNPDNSTFLCEVENLGYDATGRPMQGSDVQDAIAMFHEQKGWK